MAEKKYESILCIPDLHAPFHHPDAFKFLDAANEKYKPDNVVCLGDKVDGYAISFHDTDIPFSPSSELDKASLSTQFKEALVKAITIFVTETFEVKLKK